MLNDLAWPARGLVAAFAVAVGLMLAVPATTPPDGLASGLLLAGAVLELVVVAGLQVLRARAERRWRTELVEATDDLAAGRVEPVVAIGSVVRRRGMGVPSWLPGRGVGAGPSDVLVLTAVGDGPPRRVAACVPPSLGMRGRALPAVLLLHPDRREVAAVDDRVTAEQLGAVDADPRWRTERLPTDRTVVGGYAALLVAAAVGAGAGLGLGAAVVALAT